MSSKKRPRSPSPSNDESKRAKGEGGIVQVAKTPLVVTWKDRRVAISRRSDYKSAINAVRQSGSLGDALAKNRKFHFVAVIPGCGEYPCEISENLWEEMVQTLSEITVVLNEDVGSSLPASRAVPIQPPESTAIPTPPTSVSSSVKNIEVKVLIDDKQCVFTTKPSYNVRKLFRHAVNSLGKCSEEYRLSWGGSYVHDQETFETLDGFESGDTLEIRKEQRGGKPVIYIQTPKPLQDVSVILSLTKSWSFSAIYPPAPIKSAAEFDTIEWKVDASPDGTLRDKCSGVDVSYLYWEATTNSHLPVTPPLSPASSPSPDGPSTSLFNPVSVSVSPSAAVCLDIENVPIYLDSALKALALNTEARTSFITYWLPSLLKHKHVALQFLPQKYYEGAAPMTVSPKPDIITRVFMIFRGVSEDQLDKWSEARSRADEDVTFWTGVVGVNTVRALDASLYRVLEWGGMEVLHD